MKSGKISIGHPVDVATGMVTEDKTDIAIAGKVPLTWERHYNHFMHDQEHSPLGIGWSNRYFVTLTREESRFCLNSADGDTVYFDDPDNAVDKGVIVRNLTTSQELSAYRDNYIVTNWDVETGKIERYIFKTSGSGYEARLASIEDLTGQALDLIYDSGSHLTGVAQRLEKKRLIISYTTANQIEKVSLELSKYNSRTLVYYSYDEQGCLVAAKDARGFIDRYEYDEQKRLTREIVKDGGIFYFNYDDKDRCVKTSGLDRYDEKTLKFLDHIGWTEVTNSYGFTTRYQHTPSGQVLSVAEPTGGIKTTEYDDYGRIVKEIDALGGVIGYEYDSMGNRSKIIDQLGNCWEIEFNNFHQPVTLTASDGGVWTRKYDKQHRLIETANPLGAVWNLKYDFEGNLVSSTDPLGAEFRQSFTTNGILHDITDPLGNVTKYQFDEENRLIEKLGPMGDTTRFEYDTAGNPLRIIFPDKTTIRGEYNAGGQLTRFIDGEGRETRYIYGSCQRLLEKIDPNKNSVRFEWGTEPKQLDRVINEKGEVYTFDRDGVGRVIRETGFDKRVTRFDYDMAGRLLATTNNMDKRIVFKRNAKGMLVKETLPGGGITSFDYDPIGNLISAVNEECKVAFERDPLGRIIKEMQGDDWVETEYDAVSNIVRNTTSKGFEATYKNNANGDMVELTTNGNHTVEFNRNSYGEETSRLLPGKRARLDREYDNVGQMVEQRLHVLPKDVSYALSLSDDLSAGTKSNIAISRSYRYDNAGSLLSIDDDFWGKTEYVYDPAQRLIKALRSKGESEQFAYDSTGNMEQKISGSEEIRNTYGAGNQLQSSGDTKYEYDDNGRRIRKIEQASTSSPKEWIYTWDERDQLKTVTRPDGEVWEYAYDALGRRISKKGSDKTEQFVWYGNVVIHNAVNEIEPITWLFEHRSFRPLGKIENGNFYSVITDHLGTPREMVDEAGRIVWSVVHKSWGLVDRTGVNEVECQIRFQGQWFDDESGLCYNRFRYYDGEVGQFLCKDPIGLLGGLNEFRYSFNPINWLDPLGLKKCELTVQRDPDHDNRITSVTGFVTSENIGGGSNTNTSSRREARSKGYSTDDAGHPIARLLGGPGGKNYVFPQDSHINRGIFAQFEGRIASRILATGRSVSIVLKFDYANGGTRPTGIIYEALFQDGIYMSQYFNN